MFARSLFTPGLAALTSLLFAGVAAGPPSAAAAGSDLVRFLGRVARAH